jgi:8-oxo-dGTP diphosphatase
VSPRVRVVAAAVLRDGLLLAARRRPPHRLAGGWEFPGGKVEAGEDDRAALVRECREELDVEVAVGQLLGTAADGDLQVLLYAATLLVGEPRPGIDHDQLLWLTGAQLDDLSWLPIDRSLLSAVRPLLPPSG